MLADSVQRRSKILARSRVSAFFQSAAAEGTVDLLKEAGDPDTERPKYGSGYRLPATAKALKGVYSLCLRFVYSRGDAVKVSDYFHLLTSHNTMVVYSEAGELWHMPPDAIGPMRPLIVWRPPGNAQTAILIAGAPGMAMLRLSGFDATQRLIGVTLVRVENGLAVGMTPGRYFSAIEGTGPTREDRVEFGRTAILGWEVFTLQSCPDYKPPVELSDVFTTLAYYLSGPITAERFPLPSSPVTYTHASEHVAGIKAIFPRPQPHETLERLLTHLAPAYWRIVLQALFSVLPEAQWTEIGLRLLQITGSQLGRLPPLAGFDPWLEIAMPDLSRWLGEDRSTQTAARIIDKDLDMIAKAGLGGFPISIGHLAAIAVRKAVAPRRKCCIVATARNEGLYFLEWIGHHKSIGFDHIFIYTNNNDDGSDGLLAALAQAGEITWLKNEIATGRSAQDKAYCHALSMLPETLDFEWTAFIDLDEFITLDTSRFASIKEYFAWQARQPTNIIGLNWVMYGSNGALSWESSPMRQRFTKPVYEFSPTIKSIFGTNAFFHSQPHFPVTHLITAVFMRDCVGHRLVYDPNTELTAGTTPHVNPPAWVAHYVTKSLDEYLFKCSRNRGNFPVAEQQDDFVITSTMAEAFLKGHGVEPDDRNVAPCPQLTAEIERLTGLPNVEQAAGDIVEAFTRRLPSVRDYFRHSLAESDDPFLRAFFELIPGQENRK